MLVVAALAVLVVLGALFVLAGGSAEPGTDELAVTAPAPPPEAAPPEPAAELAAPEPQRVDVEAEATGPAYPADRLSPERFRGTGRIRGYVHTQPGVPFPTEWTLVLEPSQVLIGAEHAAARREEFAAGETEFTLEAVQLGGYDVWVEADGMASPVQQLLLSRPTEYDRTVHLQVRPHGFLKGTVLDEKGRPVEGLDVVAHSYVTRKRRTVQTDAFGEYLFERLPDGEYEVFLGPATTPLVPSKNVSFRSPSLHMPQLTVPVTGSVDVEVVDAAGRPVEGADVNGYGQGPGRIRAKTDAKGRASARFLPEGRYTLVVSHPSAGRGKHRFLLTEGALETAFVQLAP